MESKLTDLDNLAPSGDFTLNAFLLELNDDLTDEDLERLKFLCKGKRCMTVDKSYHRVSLIICCF